MTVRDCSLIVRSSCTSSDFARLCGSSDRLIPSPGPGESGGAGGVTCRGSRGDQSGTGRTPGRKTQTHQGQNQARASLLLFSLRRLTDFDLHSQPFFHKQDILREGLSLEHQGVCLSGRGGRGASVRRHNFPKFEVALCLGLCRPQHFQ